MMLGTVEGVVSHYLVIALKRVGVPFHFRHH